MAATIDLSAVAWGTVQNNGDYPPQNDPSVFVSFFSGVLANGEGTDQYRNRAILEFDLSLLAPGAVVTSALFSVTQNESNAQPGSVWRRFGYTGDGIAQLGDENVTGDVSLGDLVPTGGPGTTYSVDVTSFIASLLAGSQDFAGFVITESAANDGFGFTNYVLPGAGAGAPSLFLTYSLQSDPPPEGPAPVPEPTSLALLGVGAFGMLWRARQRRRSR